MEPFLKQIAEAFYNRAGAALKGYAFVFPSRRAGLFFRKYLAECADTPIFSPSIMTINDFFYRLSPLKPADRVQLLFRLYTVYKELTATEESFDRFLFWGEIILNDFNDIDKFGADARKLFSNLSDLRKLEADPLEYLSDEQLAAIRSFWDGFGEKGENAAFRNDFLSFWEHLHPVYSRFKESLETDGKAYEGMLARQVAEQLQNDDYVWELPFEKVVFVGFNALNRMEERLFTYLKKKGIGDFYWDYESEWIRDPLNRAAFYMESNVKNYPSQIALEHVPLPVPEIEVYGIASAVAQAKGVANILNRLYPTDSPADSGNWMETAVVLPDENLLFPLLSSIPEQIGRVNVTMGYSLAKSPIAGLMDLVFELQRNVRVNKENTSEFYHKDILNLLNHRYLSFHRDDARKLRQEVVGNNRIFTEASVLQVNPLFEAVFRAITDDVTLYAYLMRIMEQAAALLPALLPDIDNEEGDEDASLALESEFIDNYAALLNRFELSQGECRAEMSRESYFKLLRKMVRSQSIPFQGEPLSGLQIMGMLETRVLDFKNLIILSMNEGFFPLAGPSNSLIPYNLRKGFGLPAYEHRDAVYAYHFYRLVQRAGKVFFFYDTRSDGLRTGEMSRYIRQLKYLYNVNFKEKLLSYTVGVSEQFPLLVNKTPSVMEGLRTFLNDGKRFLSASAINTYLDCPLKFYLQYVRLLKEEDEIQERVEANVFGSIFHKTMEYLYEPLKSRTVPPDVLKELSRDNYILTRDIKRAFERELYRGREVKALEGEHYLIGEVIKRYVRKLLERDAELAPLQYLHSEEKIISRICLPDGNNVNIKVLIDRVDRIGGNTRLVDYKTGKGEAAFSSVEQLFDKESAARPKEVLQLFLYSLVYFNEREGADVMPSLIFLRSLFSGDSRGEIVRKADRKTHPVTSFAPYREEFSAALGTCLSELFDPSVPFAPSANKKACRYCPFVTLCS